MAVFILNWYIWIQKKFSLRRQLSGSKSATAAAPGTLAATAVDAQNVDENIDG